MRLSAWPGPRGCICSEPESGKDTTPLLSSGSPFVFFFFPVFSDASSWLAPGISSPSEYASRGGDSWRRVIRLPSLVCCWEDARSPLLLLLLLPPPPPPLLAASSTLRLSPPPLGPSVSEPSRSAHFTLFPSPLRFALSALDVSSTPAMLICMDVGETFPSFFMAVSRPGVCTCSLRPSCVPSMFLSPTSLSPSPSFPAGIVSIRRLLNICFIPSLPARSCFCHPLTLAPPLLLPPLLLPPLLGPPGFREKSSAGDAAAASAAAGCPRTPVRAACTWAPTLASPTLALAPAPVPVGLLCRPPPPAVAMPSVSEAE